MTDPSQERNQPVSDDRPTGSDRPIMGDHIDLEEVDERVLVERAEADRSDTMSRLLLPGLIVLIIVLLVIGYFVFF